ncbi:MAG: PQQ-binding-like beta-propeller repeat protein [Steroidobacteraceae bacterium]
MPTGLQRTGRCTAGIVAVGLGLISTAGQAQSLFTRSAAPHFTAVQVQRGQEFYTQTCAACHGAELAGAVAPALKGESFRHDWGDESPMTLLSYIQAQMPPTAAGTLPASTVADLGAYLLQANGYSAGATALTYVMSAGPREFNFGPRNQDATYKAAVAARTEALNAITPVTDELLIHPPDGDWLSWRRSYDSLGHSPLRQIDRRNISRLRAVWSWALPLSPDEITPLAHDGVLFIKSANTVDAFDGASGSLLWSYRRPLPDSLRGGRGDITKNLAIYRDLLFAPTADGHLVALNVHDGHVVWDQPVLDPVSIAHHLVLDGGPLVAHGKVIIGASGCQTYRGGCYIVGFDALSGQRLWRFDTIARPGQPGADSWNGAPVDERYGGSVWTSGSYDPDLNLVYFGTGQTYDSETLLQPARKPGTSADGLYTDATVALNPDTGKLVWYYQHFNRDVWDYDWVFEQSLLTLPIHGKPTKLLVTGGKIAIFDAIARSDGHYEFSRDLGLQTLVSSIDPISGRKTINPAFTPTPNKTNLICPHAGGARSWPATSFDPASDILYVPLEESCMQFTWTPRGAAASAAGGSDLHWVLLPRPDSDGKIGRLEAINLATGKVVWTRRQRAPEAASVLSTAGGLVFDGTRDRRFIASDAQTGRELWETRLDAVPSASPITYTSHGRQYIAVVAGGGGAHDATWPTLTPEIANPVGGTTLWVFGVPAEH